MSEFASSFKDICIENNLNPKRLARLVGISSSTLYSYYNGKAMPSVKNLVKLANFFKCTINFLVGLDYNQKSYDFKQTFDKSVFYPRYAKLLDENKTTHYAIKELIGASMSNLTKWKNGTFPYLYVLIEIAKHFGVSVDYLIGRSDT